MGRTWCRTTSGTRLPMSTWTSCIVSGTHRGRTELKFGIARSVLLTNRPRSRRSITMESTSSSMLDIKYTLRHSRRWGRRENAYRTCISTASGRHPHCCMQCQHDHHPVGHLCAGSSFVCCACGSALLHPGPQLAVAACFSRAESLFIVTTTFRSGAKCPSSGDLLVS